MGKIYFVATNTSEGTFVKIGWTGGPLKKRLGQLQTGCPFPLDVLATVAGTEEDERKLHEFYADKREMGEWFLFEDIAQDLWPVIDASGKAIYGADALQDWR